MANFDIVRPKLAQANHNPTHEIVQKPRRRGRFGKWVIVILIIIALAGFGGFKLLSKTNQIFTGQGNIFSRFSSLILSPDKPLIGEDEGLVNVLLMGVGGSGHEGAYLTDTMIVASINTNTSEVVLVSIPRDFALDLANVGYNKINAAYAYAYRDNPQTAGDAAIAAAQQVTGYKIPYYAVIDFKGFVQAVDHVGGVNVTVDHAFTDSTFPNDFPYDTKGYLAPVTFAKGQQYMDGHRALIFARSRHSGDANEGSDFARSERQKKIIVAIRTKILKLNLTNLATINNLLTDFTENFRTNLEPFELKRLGDISKKIDPNSIYSLTLEPTANLICSALVDPKTGKRVPDAPINPPAPEPTLVPQTPATPTNAAVPEPAPEIQKMYVVHPCEGKTLADIHDYLVNTATLAKYIKEGAVVEIQSSTGKTISPSKFNKLIDLGINVQYVKFLGKSTYEQTILYDNSRATKPVTLEAIKTNYNYPVSDVNFPGSTADFVIILGKDAF
ncbi:MAG: LCP family protein [Candidatus Doudnabacteria bacterium]